MVDCKLCCQTKKNAYIHAAGSTLCTECALEVVKVATHIGLVDMGQKLREHHMMSGPRVSPIGGKHD